MRALILAEADRLHVKAHDRAIRNVIGLTLAAALVVGWAALWTLDHLTSNGA